jgi:glycosyltransferase involved in cell wall biosynthesis
MLPQIYLEASHTARTNSRTGIQMVVRGLVEGLSSQGCGVRPLFWSFRRRCLTPLIPRWEKNLGLPGGRTSRRPIYSLFQPGLWPLLRKSPATRYRVPVQFDPTHGRHFQKGWLILPELMTDQHLQMVVDYARKRRMKVAGIFHDAIAWRHPEMVRHWSREAHGDYMRALTGLDVVIPISFESGRHLQEFAAEQGLPAPRIRVCPLPAQQLGQERETKVVESAGRRVRILCVSTLEPRKNHARILNAFRIARHHLPGVEMELHLVGAAYAAAPEIAGAVRLLTESTPSIFWHEGVSSEDLRNFYRDCDFTIFGSWIEGFGLPVMESLWFGKPCLCSDQGVIAENADGGGCLTVNVQDTRAMAAGIIKLAGEPLFREELAREARRRPLKTWSDYGGEILQILRES